MAALAGVPKLLQKTVKGTNIVVRKAANDGIADEKLSLLYSIGADDATELQWFHHTLRPEKNLIHPSESFLQGIKALRPAVAFNTFDVKKSKLRRMAKQQKDKMKAMRRREKEVAPTAAFKAAMNPHKVPRTGGHAPEDEVRFLSRGIKKKTAKKQSGDGNSEAKPAFYTKWKKQKAKRVGKGL